MVKERLAEMRGGGGRVRVGGGGGGGRTRYGLGVGAGVGGGSADGDGDREGSDWLVGSSDSGVGGVGNRDTEDDVLEVRKGWREEGKGDEIRRGTRYET